MSKDLPLLQEDSQELTYDFYVKARNGNKRDFIFSWAKARKCSHPNLVITAIGGNTYRCTECNYFYTIVSAYVEPMHLATVKAAYQLLHFGKEFGVAALQEVLRQPHGQSDGTPHKGVIPDNMTLSDTLLALETVNVNSPDKGRAEMAALVEAVWPNEVEVQRRIEALQGSDLPEKQAYAALLETLLEVRHGLEGGKESKALPARKRRRSRKGNKLPTVQAGG